MSDLNFFACAKSNIAGFYNSKTNKVLILKVDAKTGDVEIKIEPFKNFSLVLNTYHALKNESLILPCVDFNNFKFDIKELWDAETNTMYFLNTLKITIAPQRRHRLSYKFIFKTNKNIKKDIDLIFNKNLK